jgi:putative ABC transport system ATP-binding protein
LETRRNVCAGQRARPNRSDLDQSGGDVLMSWKMTMDGTATMPASLAADPRHRATVFHMRNLSKVYRTGAGDVHALRGIDLDIFPAEFLVLLGPSGSGKSTLLNILGGLDRASGGDVSFRDADLTRMSDHALTLYRRHHVGFVFQFYNLIPSLTARENVGLVTEIAKNPMTPEEALTLVGLEQRFDHFPAQLSGGEQQRVAIARAIAKRPEVLLCDEPTGALDCATGVTVLEAIARINEQLGTTAIIITHNAAIASIADRVVSFANGQIAKITANPARAPVRALSW